MRIAITGANSSVGKVLLRHVVERDDVEARAGVRRLQAIETLPNDPSITARVIDFDDKGTLLSLFDDVSCVVHLAGILIESKHTSHKTANMDATAAVVEACRHAEVSHIVFVSSLGADATSGNAYLRSKGIAEQVIADSGISSTIIRTPILLGPGTAGAVSLVAMASRTTVRVLGGGRHRLRPLDVDDLSIAILNCCREQPEGIALHELVGPEPVTHRDLIIRTGRLMGHDVSVSALPIWAVRAGAALAGWVRRGGMTPTVIDVITTDEVVKTNADAALGVSLTPLSATLDKLVLDEKSVRQ